MYIPSIVYIFTYSQSEGELRICGYDIVKNSHHPVTKQCENTWGMNLSKIGASFSVMLLGTLVGAASSTTNHKAV